MRKRIAKNRQVNRLIARAVAKVDLNYWMELYKDPEVRRHMYAVPMNSKEALWEYLNCEQKAFTVWENDQRIGGFLLSTVAPFLGTFSIVIHKKFRGSGYGHKVMGLIEVQALREGYTTLRADVYVDNFSSLKLLAKCGFRKFIWLEKNL